MKFMTEDDLAEIMNGCQRHYDDYGGEIRIGLLLRIMKECNYSFKVIGAMESEGYFFEDMKADKSEQKAEVEKLKKYVAEHRDEIGKYVNI